MEFSTTTKYAIQILGLMAQNKENKYSSKQLSENLNIPYKYLTKIMTKLTKNDIVSSTRGKYGGFSIIKDIKDIKIIDIVVVFDDVNTEQCILTNDKHDFEQTCMVHDQWEKARCAIDDFFTKTTLLELINQSTLIEAVRN